VYVHVCVSTFFILAGVRLFMYVYVVCVHVRGRSVFSCMCMVVRGHVRVCSVCAHVCVCSVCSVCSCMCMVVCAIMYV